MAKTFSYRILVVDDEEAVLLTTAAILKDAGYVVNTARDGFEALASLRGSVPEILITDLQMPGMSGFELLGVIRKRFPSIAVIASSGQYTPVSLPEGVLADRFLAKGDAPPMELLELVRQLTSEGPSRSQPAKAEIAPAWVPRSSRGYVVLTCPDCLRSFSVLSNVIEVGKNARETCLHCGIEISYYLDASVMAEPLSASESMRRRIDSANKTIEASRQMIDDTNRAMSESRRKKAAR
ncbi:MAG TPA: response regulator [Terriglobales bacterium]